MIYNNTILIGIAGGTGSGKTSIANALSSNFGESEVILIEQDSYYKDLSHLPLIEREIVNFDHPDSIDFLLMKKHLQDLLNGVETNIPIYDFTTHTRKKETRDIKKHRIIILEGILSLFDENIRNMMDIKVYVETPDDIRIIRRILRDIEERDRNLPAIIKQYYKTVRPMHIEFVEPTKKYADIIIPEGGKNIVAIDILRTKIVSLILNNKV